MDPTSRSVGAVTISSAEGVALHGDLAVPAGATQAAVLCHPHPRYGGNRFNAVVDALFTVLPAAGVAALRFDFRPGAGAPDGDLGPERADLDAAIDEVVARLPAVDLAVVGYSFGAAVALTADHGAIGTLVAIAPPLAMVPGRARTDVSTLLLVPAHDQFTSPEAARAQVATWAAGAPVELEVVEMADHFLGGRTRAVADRVVGWLRSRPAAGAGVPHFDS